MIQFRLKEQMERRGVTFRQTATGADVALSTLHKVATNQTVQTDVLEKLCKFFGCGLSDLAQYVPDEAAADSGPAGESDRPS